MNPEPKDARLRLAVHGAVRFILVRPHYPENVGATARALKTMGFCQLALVKPGRLAVPEHEMAYKMAVKSQDVLQSVRVHPSLAEASAGCHRVFATTSRRGISGVLTPREVAPRIVAMSEQGLCLAFVFGNEKTGLSQQDLGASHERVRIPMAAEQPSINLAQAAQLIAYELFLAALAARQASRLLAQLPSSQREAELLELHHATD